MNVTIRPAVPADAAAISAVQISARRQAYAEIMSPEALDLMATQASPQRWAERLDPVTGRGWILVAIEAETIIGFVFVSPSSEGLTGVGDLDALHVAPARQGTGAGGRLLDAGLELLAQKGFSSYALWVLEGNEHAIRFYLKRGWRHDGQRIRDVVGDFLRFVRQSQPDMGEVS